MEVLTSMLHSNETRVWIMLIKLVAWLVAHAISGGAKRNPV